MPVSKLPICGRNPQTEQDSFVRVYPYSILKPWAYCNQSKECHLYLIHWRVNHMFEVSENYNCLVLAGLYPFKMCMLNWVFQIHIVLQLPTDFHIYAFSKSWLIVTTFTLNV